MGVYIRLRGALRCLEGISRCGEGSSLRSIARWHICARRKIHGTLSLQARPPVAFSPQEVRLIRHCVALLPVANVCLRPCPVAAGPKAAGKNALIGGVLLALIEGLSVLLTKMTAPAADPYAADAPEASMALAPPTDPNALIPAMEAKQADISDMVDAMPTDAWASGPTDWEQQVDRDLYNDGGYDTRDDTKYQSSSTSAQLDDDGSDQGQKSQSWRSWAFGGKN